MKRSFLLHPGTILATVVLVAAVSGSVYAASNAGGITSAQIQNGTIKLKDINPAARASLRGARGPAGATGATGATGAAGAAGSARAFGYVSSAGVLDPARSKNLSATKLSGTGEYCVTPVSGSGIDVSKVLPVVSADFTDGSGFFHLAQIVSFQDATICAGWRVFTDNFSAGAFTRTNIAFSILVP